MTMRPEDSLRYRPQIEALNERLSQRDGAIADLAEFLAWLKRRRWMIITVVVALLAVLATPMIILTVLAMMIGVRL